MTRCPQCDTPLCLKLAAEPVPAVREGWAVKTESGCYLANRYTYFFGIEDAHIFTDIALANKACRSGEKDKVVCVQLTADGWQELPATELQVEPVAEKDRHGREIVKREGHAMVVKCKPESDGRSFYLIVGGEFWFTEGTRWTPESERSQCLGTIESLEDALIELKLAAATPLPHAAQTALENLKVEPGVNAAKVVLHDWEYHPDPSGNNDTYHECKKCGTHKCLENQHDPCDGVRSTPAKLDRVYPLKENAANIYGLIDTLTRRIESLESELARQQDRVRKLEAK